MFLADELFQICRAHFFGERLRGWLLFCRWSRCKEIHEVMLTYLDAADTGRSMRLLLAPLRWYPMAVYSGGFPRYHEK
jgi:hypothetical protein